MRLTEILYRHNTTAKRQRTRYRVGSYSGKNLTRLAQDATKESRAKHFHYLDWSRAFLSKSRYMCGLQCPKRLWQAVYDPEAAEEPLPGTAKSMGIEVGIKARLLWPGGVLVDDPGHHRQRRRPIRSEMNAFHQAVGREHIGHAARRLDNRRIVADAEPYPGRRCAHAPAKAFDQRVLAYGLNSDGGQEKGPALPCGEVV